MKNAEPDILGRATQYLLRKFAEGQGQSAGEFYTPYEVGVLMARLIDPRPGERGVLPGVWVGGVADQDAADLRTGSIRRDWDGCRSCTGRR